jgi:Flp pilus assembly protein TadG
VEDVAMSRIGMSQRLVHLGRELRRREDGAVLVYVSIALTVFMGFAALVIDGGRLFTVDTELQSAADALALAGAAELDGNADAITRATNAINTLVQNNSTLSNDTSTITVSAPIFLSALPDDDQPLSAVEALSTTDPAVARFVEVKLTNADGRSISTLFATAIGGSSTAPADAVAVAGFTSAVCKFTPLFMCNPYENLGVDTLAEFTARVETPAEKRKTIALKRQGSGAKYTPGNFGFLESIDDDTKFKESLAKADPGVCFEKDGVNTKPGSKVSARQPLNTRFDMYQGSFKNGPKYKNNINYRPARNVTKGTIAKNAGQACSPDPDITVPPATPLAKAFPVDSNIINNTIWLGNGDWGGVDSFGVHNFDKYWNVNHPGVSKPNSWSKDNLPSRYDVYRWEIDTGHIPNNSTKSPKGENGNPQCSGTSNQVSDSPDRRVIYSAVINCNQYDSLLNGGSGDDIPVLAFVKMFMTQPMTKNTGKDDDDEDVASDNTLYVEMIDVVKPGIDDAVIHDVVQLYR